VIVWSRGLGKQRLPLELADAELKIAPDHLIMEGIIEPVWWNYRIMLEVGDLKAFLKHLATRETADFGLLIALPYRF
jgi:hypothetical protein